MSSYISSFKALLVALATIGLIEGGYVMFAAPSAADRTNYLNWNFDSSEPFHKVVIYEKIINAIRDRPEVIQIGDSSGFHGIIPSIVDQYLGGMRYANVSCCANTGFDGYYTIADYLLRNVPTIKVVVLYFSLNNSPRTLDALNASVVGGEDRLRSAFGPMAAWTSPATLALRHDIVRPVYNLGTTFEQNGLLSFDKLWPAVIQALRASRGWRPEEDVHRLPAQQMQKVYDLCGPSLSRHVDVQDWDFTRDVFGVRRSNTEIELRRLAALTARHGAKLILLTQPYPCHELPGTYLEQLRSAVAAVAADYSNFIAPNPLFESWPPQWFSSGDHLRIGMEDLASRRAGRSIAKALNIAYPEPTTEARGTLRPVVKGFHGWTAKGVAVEFNPDGSSVTVTEAADSGPHELLMDLPWLPAGTYLAAIRFRTSSSRHVFFRYLPLRYPGDGGNFRCSFTAGEVSRTRSVIDSTIEEDPDGSMTCSGKFTVTSTGTELTVGLSPTTATIPYAGDAHSSVELYDFELSTFD
ncbi:hypothetical protein SAMN02990966_05903 [Rhodospirillales bacterium URHD0017]|nr:hypothetical protein SAMN02990966_05903 [Rhodospirillales bacterium URHD0017]